MDGGQAGQMLETCSVGLRQRPHIDAQAANGGPDGGFFDLFEHCGGWPDIGIVYNRLRGGISQIRL